MRPDFVDADSALKLERTANATPQVAVLVAALAHPPAPPKTFDQVVTVRANDQVAQSALEQLEEHKLLHSQSSWKRSVQGYPNCKALRERHHVRDSNSFPSSPKKSSIMAIRPATAFRVPIERVVRARKPSVDAPSAPWIMAVASTAGGGSNPVVKDAGSLPRSHGQGHSAASL